MHWTLVLILISLVINCILAYVLHNSHLCYRSTEPFKMALVWWVLVGISTLIPVINIIATLIYVVFACMAYANEEIEVNEDFWLAKKY